MRLPLFFLMLTASLIQAADYPEGVSEISYLSKADGTQQPSLFWKPDTDEKRPLLVALHTWSSTYLQTGGEVKYAEWCQQQGWIFIHPNFRGPNRTPEAMGSGLAVADVLSAIDYAKENATVDEERIYCIGVSGGGHMSLLMAGSAPEIWAGVSAWCGISDIAAWHQQCRDSEKFSRYADHIEKALETDDPKKIKRAAKSRSPLTHLEKARSVNLDIHHGIRDGRAGSVPFSHSLNAFNAAANPDHRIGSEIIAQFYETQQSPAPTKIEDVYFTENPIHYRLVSDSTRVTIFEGGHEILHEAALNWLAAQRKGSAPVWNAPRVGTLKIEAKDRESGK